MKTHSNYSVSDENRATLLKKSDRIPPISATKSDRIQPLQQQIEAW
jgi:hypothetical protein